MSYHRHGAQPTVAVLSAEEVDGEKTMYASPGETETEYVLVTSDTKQDQQVYVATCIRLQECVLVCPALLCSPPITFMVRAQFNN